MRKIFIYLYIACNLVIDTSLYFTLASHFTFPSSTLTFVPWPQTTYSDKDTSKGHSKRT